jgi:hypothetical protein
MTAKRQITRDDILSLDEYEKVRSERRKSLIEAKKLRRVSVGPYATFYFENWDTMWWQIHEMLRIEKGGEEQISDELSAYAPLIPNGKELIATMMFEIDDPKQRDVFLRKVAYVEDHITIELDGDIVKAVPELQDGVERTTPDGKTSSIHFLHFPFTDAQVAKFRDSSVRAVLAIEHDGYAHMAVIPADVKQALAADFD